MNPARVRILAVACVAALATSGCAKPPVTMPDQSVIGYDGHAAVPPDCESLSRPSVLTDAGWHRPSMEWGCATYTNLAAQLARPRDLVAPEKLGPADGAVAAGGVRRYETDKVTPLDTETSRSAK
jgi:pilus assembly protein CpaD